ncbi:MAG: glycosyltransferase family 4 protein [Pseudomonadota bacterium]
MNGAAPDKERPIISIISKQRMAGALNGSSAYLIAIAQSLGDAGFDVELIQPSPTIAGRIPFMTMRPEMSVFSAHKVRGARHIARTLVFANPSVWFRAVCGVLARLSQKLPFKALHLADKQAPYAIATPWLDEDRAFLRSSISPDTRAIIADYMFCAECFAEAPRPTPTAIVMHDLFHARAGGDKDSVALVSREEEIAALSKAGTVFAIQQDEQGFLEQNVPATHPILVPMPAFPVEKPQVGQTDQLLFIGSNTAPNVEGLRDFAESTWPLVLARRPNARLKVAGTMNRAFTNPDYRNVSFLGIVDDLAPLYRDAGVVISPLTFGSGLKIKLVEAMAQGKAMVVSPVTLQGVETVCSPGVQCTSSPDQTADAICDLMEDEAARTDLAAKALSISKDHFSAEAVHADLREWAKNLL